MLMQMIDALKMARGNGLFTRPISLRNSGFAFQIVDDVGAYVCQRVNGSIERAANAPFPTIEAIEEEWEVITADEV